MAFMANMGLNFDAVPSLENERSSFSDYLSAVASDAWGYNPSVATYRALELQGTKADVPDVNPSDENVDITGGFDDQGEWTPVTVGEGESKSAAPLSLEDQKARIEAEGLTGMITPQEGYTEESLKLLFEHKHQEKENAWVREHAPGWMAPVGFVGSLGVSMLDPINLAAGFMPVVSHARQLRMLQGASGAMGRAGQRALIGAAEGLAGTAAIEPVIQLSRSVTQGDYEFYNTLFNLALGTVMGSTLHVGKGALGEWIRNKRGQRHEWEISLPTDESELLRQQMARDIFDAAQEAGAERIDSDAAEAAAILFDVRARQWAYDFRESGGTIEGFYERYAPAWKAGTVEAGGFLGGGNVRTFLGGLSEGGLERGQAAARIVDAFQEAQFREASGMHDMDSIARETGWRKSEDGKWQYEGREAGDVLHMTSILSSTDPRIEWRQGTEGVSIEKTEIPSLENGKEPAIQALATLDGKTVKTPGLGEIHEVRFEKNKGLGETRKNRNRGEEIIATYPYVEELLSKAQWFRREPNVSQGKGHVVHAISSATIGGEDYGVIFTLKSAMGKDGVPYWRYYGHTAMKIGDMDRAVASSTDGLQLIVSESPTQISLFDFLGRVKKAGEEKGSSRLPKGIEVLKQERFSESEMAVPSGHSRLPSKNSDALSNASPLGGGKENIPATRESANEKFATQERIADDSVVPDTTGREATSGETRESMASSFQQRIDALENLEGMSLADRAALTSDLKRGILASRHQEIEETVRAINDGARPAGPEPDDAVSGPAILHQWQNVPEWKQRLTDWMKKDGYSDAEIAEKVGAIEGQMRLYEALGAKLEVEVQGAHAAKRASNQGVKYSGPVRSNSDEIYVISFDCSSQCVKRLAAANTAKIAEEALGRPLKVEEQMALIALERAKGQEAPCVYCYVESNRARARQAVGHALDLVEKGEIPKAWGRQRKEAAQAAIRAFRDGGLRREDLNYEYVLNQTIRNTPEISAIREDPRYRDIYAYLDFEANATKQNIAKPYEEYTGELLDLTPEQVEMLNGYAGMRFFSTSDFQVEHVVDLIQAFWDMNALGLKTHGYTKVPLYVDIFGDTGQKINMSCFAKVDPATGEVRMDEAQGWNWDKAREYREKHPDVGIIFVCANDKILNWAMNQPWVDYCIPFHFSGLEKQYYMQLGWQDFTRTQMEQNIYATKRTQKSGVFEERPIKAVNATEQEALNRLPPEQASIEYAKICFARRLYPVKPEEFFTPELIEGKTKKQRADAAKELWTQMLESEAFDESMINPGYWEKYKTKGAKTKEKTVDDVSVNRVRMHEMGTQEGITDAEGTKRYLELCMERKIYPVFTNYLFKGYKEQTLSPPEIAKIEEKHIAWGQKNEKKIRAAVEKSEEYAAWKTAHPDATPEMQAKYIDKKVSEEIKLARQDQEAAALQGKRAADVKKAKERWEDMVIKGEIDWDAINPNFFKLKKDYARTDTPFRVPDPHKINTMAARRPLEETLSKGLAEKYHGDPDVADQLVRLSRYGEENGVNVGSASLQALRRGEHPLTVAGEQAELDRSQANSLWQRRRRRKSGQSYDERQRQEAEAMGAQRRPVEEGEPEPAPAEETASPVDEAPLPMGEEQGRITFNALEDGRALIEIFKAADATTPPHELYHLFRRQMAESAQDPAAPARVKDMYQQACDFVGAKPGEAWTVEQEEMFARAGERYLHEGVAPTANLQDLFDRMKDWFTEVYGAAEERGFTISDEMRKLFGDMMLSPSMKEADAAFRYSLGRLLSYNPAEGADVHPFLRPDGDSSSEVLREMQDAATERVEQRLEMLSRRLPERDIAAFREEFEAAMRAEDEAIAATAREREMFEEALMCEMRGA